MRFTRRQDESRWYAGVNGYLYRPEEVGGTAGGTRSTAAGGLIGITQSFSEALRIDANAGLMHFTEPTKDDDWKVRSGRITPANGGSRGSRSPARPA